MNIKIIKNNKYINKLTIKLTLLIKRRKSIMAKDKNETITKVMRFELLDIIDNDKSLMYKILNELQEQTWKIKNETIRMLWDIDNDIKDINKCKEKYSDYFKWVDLGTKYGTNDGYIYDQLKTRWENVNPSSLNATIRDAKQRWGDKKEEINDGEVSFINFKKKNANPIVAATQIKIKPTDKEKEYILDIPLLSKKYADFLFETGIEINKGKKKQIIKKNNNDIHVLFKIKTNDKYQQSLIDNILDGTYKKGASEFLYNESKNKWFINLTFSFVPEKNKLDQNKIMGIDLGWNIPAVLGLNDNNKYKQYIGSREEIESFYHQQEARKKRMQQQAKWCGDGRRGHGTITRLKPVYKARDKVSQFHSYKNHCFSKYIINEAIKLGVGKIQMEDLKGIKNDKNRNVFLKRWTYFDLQTKIENKAKEKGIEFIKIKPKYTSARCNKCGYVNGIKYGESKEGENGWRPDQEHFHCLNPVCNHKDNADANAAKNIALKDIDKIIEKQVKLQEKINKKILVGV
jgi:IS605 OrfB family transposase